MGFTDTTLDESNSYLNNGKQYVVFDIMGSEHSEICLVYRGTRSI